MNEIDQGPILHDRESRGIPLSDAERNELDSWYAENDREEHQLLTSNATADVSANIQFQLDAAVAELPTLAKQVQVLIRHNDLLRRENAALQQLLARG